MSADWRTRAAALMLPGMVSLLITASASEVVLSPGVNLFFVKRSLNDNEVHYDAVVKKDSDGCSWKKPYVVSYWRDLQQGDHVYSKIRWWEQPAYGFWVFRLDDKTVDIRLRALESADIELPVIARLAETDKGCRITTSAVIEGSESEFQSAYIRVSGLLNLSYDYFDLLGYVKGRQGSQLDRIYQRFERDRDKSFSEEPPSVLWQSGVVDRGLKMGRPLAE